MGLVLKLLGNTGLHAGRPLSQLLCHVRVALPVHAAGTFLQLGDGTGLAQVTVLACLQRLHVLFGNAKGLVPCSLRIGGNHRFGFVHGVCNIGG
jgi:hypothetical protein